jgi:hypothetical protein
MIARKKMLKSALGFGCVGGLLALINFSRAAPEKNLLPATDSKVSEEYFSELKLLWQS